jgi:type VI secretion system protein ImpA
MSVETATVDIESILAPIPGDKPSGENLQYSGLHDEIREARRADDPTTKADWQTEMKVADWDEVVSLAESALKTQTKDLQVGAWMCEALLNRNGFAGLRDGLKVMCGLHENFWDSIYPEIDEGDLDARANCLALMDRQCAFAAKEVALTDVRGEPNYSYLGWEKTKLPDDFNKISQANREEADRIKQESEKAAEEWNRLNRSTPRRFYEQLNTLLSQCWEEFQGLDRAMDQKFGRQTPGLGELKKSLENLRSVVDKIVKEKRVLEPDPVGGDGVAAGETAEVAVGQAAGAGAGSVSVSVGAIRGRQEALRRLSEIAEFFQKTEPHSPVSYLVERAVKWGNMPLEQWLQEVIKDSTVLGQVQETLGVKAEGSGY